MNPFEFSDQMLGELERVQGPRGVGRGKIDRRGNRQLVRALAGTMKMPARMAVAFVAAASSSKPARSARALATLGRTAKCAPQVIVKITSRLHGTPSTLGAFTYVSRLGMSDQEPLELQTSEGKVLTSAVEMMALAREWQKHEMSDPARRKGATAIAMVFSMPPGTDPAKVLNAVKELAETHYENRRWALTLHTDEPHPHVHLIIAGRDHEGRRFNPDREFLQQSRERFAELLRERGIEADATNRITRGYPPKRDVTPVIKMRERGLTPIADQRAVEALKGETPDVQERVAKREAQRSKMTENAAMVKAVYSRAVEELKAHGGKEELERAKALRSFINTMPEPVNARAEIIERLRNGNALPDAFAKDPELETLKARVDARRERERRALIGQLAKGAEAVKDKTARLRATGAKGRAGEGDPDPTRNDPLEQIRQKTAKLVAQTANGPVRDIADPISRDRLNQVQQQLRELVRDKERERARELDRVKDKTREGPKR